MKIKFTIFFLTLTLTCLGQEDDTLLNTQKRKVDFVALPQPSYNDVQGFGFALTAGVFYLMNSSDSLSKPSLTLAHGFYSENNTWVGAVIQEGFLHNNDYWFKFIGVKSNWNFQYYQELPFENNNGAFIQYSTSIGYLEYDFLRKVTGDFYAGIYGKYSSFYTEFKQDNSLNEALPTYSREAKYHGLGFMMAYDTRNNILKPSKGFVVDLKVSAFRNKIGSDNNFEILELNMSHYVSVGKSKKHILASKFYSKIGVNDVPFEEQAIVGMSGTKHNEPRGYTNGRYRGKQMYSLQAEWRYNFYNKWGIVTFGSVSIVGDDSDMIEENGILPTIGLGIRYLAIPKRNINIGIDAAWGKEDKGIYFSIGEAF
ncbi:BamA/TamA family outer membrane protein [Flammeovirga kamogawensis]|uniref:BamA/TamA family outer membrane protein n=1 Tax=Flammeovirga kamogawensis TaxID=373891 RepID=A0ABX8GZS3_9BACT|nr:BamA/TamA family outer membrane protein [Flammeovirga kamogawensis]MBB6459335.1 outer membrane protein assembly factor BamA [Flammeovirga kamogawensis]QWG08894.1 BamA/TamA family outer membrane protein [Flammeovirga kamogawensis]TRX67184.1 BamA/TamA family outer membrane protein [Flammeovirga kamogawensis]